MAPQPTNFESMFPLICSEISQLPIRRRISLIGFGGSYAYGTQTEDSDIDVRGIALNTKEEILLGKDFEQIQKKVDDIDIVIYSFNKVMRLLANCNPNMIEMLRLEPEQFFADEIGRDLIANYDMFLSKRVIDAFGGYAASIVYNLKSDNIGKRNRQAIKRNKLSKHMMHLIRLYLMCFDIVEKGEIRTYRSNDHDILMIIRDGGYLRDGIPTPEFFKIVEGHEQTLQKLKKSTKLPDKPDMKRIEDFKMKVNEKIVLGDIGGR